MDNPRRSLATDLTDLGIATAHAAIASAKPRGVTPEDLRQWIEEFREKPGAWGVGALVARLTGKLTVWPAPSDEYVRRQARARSHRDQLRQAQARAKRRTAQERQRAAERNLE